MTKSQFLLYIIVITLITSCATHFGTINNSQVPHSSKGIIYQDKVYGYSSCHYVLGIGGMGSQGLAAEAIFNLKCAVKLDTGEYLDNFTIDHRRFYFVPFYVHHEVLVTADKIKDLDNNKVLYDTEYNRQNDNFDDKEGNYFLLNEKVFVQKQNGGGLGYEAIIVKHLRNSAKVISIGNKGKIKRRKFNYKYIFKKDGGGNISFFLTAKKGDTVSFNDVFSGEFYLNKAVLMGSNNSKLLLKYLNGSKTHNADFGYKTYVADLRTIIIEDSTQAMKENLNRAFAHILKTTKSEQKLIGRATNNELIYGKFNGFEGNNVMIQLDDSTEDVMLDMSSVYTIENWLEFSSEKYDKHSFQVNDKVTYYQKTAYKGVNAKILGFRYHNVLIRTDNGEMLEVPIGKLM